MYARVAKWEGGEAAALRESIELYEVGAELRV
jgi:hypothetical protein